MESRFAKLGALAALGATLCCSSALAQQTYNQYQVNEGKTANPQAADIQNVDFYVGGTYNSNVTDSDEAVAEARGLKQADWDTQVGMNATVIQTLGIQRFFVRGDAEYTWYARNHVLDYAFAHFAGGDSIRVGGQCALTGQGDYYRKRSDDVAFVTSAIENVATTGAAEVNFDCGQKKFGIAPSVGVIERWNTNSSDFFRNSDNRIFTVTAGLDYRNPVLGSLGFFGEYDDVKFDHATLDVMGTLFRDSFYDWSAGGRYVKQFDPRFGIMATLTYTSVGSNIPDGPDFHGVTYSFDATYNPAPRLFGHAYFSRQVMPSDEPLATFTVSELYEADWAYAVNQMLRVSLRGWLNDIHYHETTSLMPLIDLNSQRIYFVEGDAAFRINNHLWIDAFVGEQHGDINVPGFDYWSTRVGFKVRVNFGPA